MIARGVTLTAEDEVLAFANGQPPTQAGVFLWEPSLGALALDCEHGYVITSFDLGFPQVRESVWNLPLRNGTFDSTCYTGQRAISLGMTIGETTDCGHVGGSLDAMLSRLRAYVNPCLRPLLLYTPDGSATQRQITVRGVDCPAVFERRQTLGVVAQFVSVGSGMIEAAQETCREIRPGVGDQVGGRAYDLVFDRAYPYAGGPGGSYLVRNEGSAPASWVATIHGAIDRPVLTINGQDMAFTRNGGVNLAQGSFMEVSERERTVVLDNGESRYSRWDFTQGWPMLPPGDNYVSLDGDSFSAEASAKFCMTTAWY